MLKNPQKRVTIAKTALVVMSLLMGLGIMGFWLYALGFQGQVKRALGMAATVKSVTFSADDALAMQKLRAKAAETAGQGKTGDAKTSHTQTSESKSGEGKSGDRKSGDGKSGSGSREWASRVFFPDEFAGLLETRPLFGAPPRQGTPQANLQGILGDTALINGNWMKVGETQNGVKLVKTLVGKVTVEIEGQERDVSVFSELPYKPSPDGPKTLMASMSPAMGGGSMSPKERASLRRSGRGGGSFTGRSRRGGGSGRSASDMAPPSMNYSGSRRGGGSPDAMGGGGGFGSSGKGMRKMKGADGGANNNFAMGASNMTRIASAKPGKLPKGMRGGGGDMGGMPAGMSGGGNSYPMDNGGSMGKKGKKKANYNAGGGGGGMGADYGNMPAAKPAKKLPGGASGSDMSGQSPMSGGGPGSGGGMRGNRGGGANGGGAPNGGGSAADRIPSGKKKAAANGGAGNPSAKANADGGDGGAPGDKPKGQRKAKNLRN